MRAHGGPAGRWSRALADAPAPVTWSIQAALAAGVVGALVGIVLGLRTYPPTAWFAAIEVGLPAAVVGGLAGLGLGAGVSAVRARRSTRRPPPR